MLTTVSSPAADVGPVYQLLLFPRPCPLCHGDLVERRRRRKSKRTGRWYGLKDLFCTHCSKSYRTILKELAREFRRRQRVAKKRVKHRSRQRTDERSP